MIKYHYFCSGVMLLVKIKMLKDPALIKLVRNFNFGSQKIQAKIFINVRYVAAHN